MPLSFCGRKEGIQREERKGGREGGREGEREEGREGRRGKSVWMYMCPAALEDTPNWHMPTDKVGGKILFTTVGHLT